MLFHPQGLNAAFHCAETELFDEVKFNVSHVDSAEVGNNWLHNH